MFAALLYTSLTIFIIGMLYRVFTWFTRDVGAGTLQYTTGQRISAFFKGILGVVFSAKIFTLVKVFILDVVLQRKILKQDCLRWLMHMLIYDGFMLLLLMHAMDSLITANLFDNYYSTLNPFLFLRDLFGFMVLVGVAIALLRRFVFKIPRLKSNGRDHYAIAILVLIMLSGVMLEAVKFTSHTEFTRMVEDYAGMDDEDEIAALEAVWIKDYGLVSPEVQGPFDEALLEAGREAHQGYCMDCHASNQNGFCGYAAAKLISPPAVALDEAGAVTFFWYFHILACFVGLAYLPFSKMLHIITTPLSLLANAVMKEGASDPVNIATRQALELDACMHCTTCSKDCSMGIAYNITGNECVLPSEKLAFLRRLAANKKLSPTETQAIVEGIYLCTNCDRCTVACPAGINLRELWYAARERIIAGEVPPMLALTNLSFARGLRRVCLDAAAYTTPVEKALKLVGAGTATDDGAPIDLGTADKAAKAQSDASAQTGNTYAACFACENCSTVCPVVGNYDDPKAELDLLPHQIMRCLGLGLTDLARGSRMLWSCLTCYQCQEHCPQQVAITDVLYELKNQAFGQQATLKRA